MTDKLQYLNKFQTELKESIKGTQKWWTEYLFHFTDISNALSILDTGALYSRKMANDLDLMKNDNANDSVISHTSNEHKKNMLGYILVHLLQHNITMKELNQ